MSLNIPNAVSLRVPGAQALLALDRKADLRVPLS